MKVEFSHADNALSPGKWCFSAKVPCKPVSALVGGGGERGRDAGGCTFAGLVIWLNVHLPLGQNLGELPLQLLIFLVVGNSVN